MNRLLSEEQLKALLDLVQRAGQKILEIRDSNDLSEQIKDGGSPVTAADLASNELLMGGLGSIIDSPIVSEEDDALYPEGDYWLIDPLDGTSDFIKGSENFAVMAAYMQNQQPVFGVVYAPVKNEMFYGGSAVGGSFQSEGSGSEPKSIQPANTPVGPLKVVASRSHMHPKTEQYLKELGEHELLSIGSGLKFCYVANGQIDVYVRYQGTKEWDTAAPQAIAQAAGALFEWEDSDFKYGKNERQNTGFICRSPNVIL